jgi:adenylate kinase family enzyme
MDDGKFVSDEIVNNLIKNALSDPKKKINWYLMVIQDR